MITSTFTSTFTSRFSAVKAAFALVAIIAFFALPDATAHAQETPPAPEKAAAKTRPAQELFLNGFRSPSIGLEFREGPFSVHTGYYTTILARTTGSRSKQFIKTGATYYFSGNQAREMYFSAAHLRGLSDGWKGNGAFLEYGTRWRIGKRLDLRFGTGLLLMSGKSARVNPTPGISLSIPLR